MKDQTKREGLLKEIFINLSIKMMAKILMFTGIFIFLITSCDNPPPPPYACVIITPDMTQSEVQEALITVEDGCVIQFVEGSYNFVTTLSIADKNDLTFKGAGMDQTILSFSGQQAGENGNGENEGDDHGAGSEGILVTNCTNFTIKDLTVEESAGDGIKTKDCTGVTFQNIATVWHTDNSTENGAYGIYPVLCTGILVEDCYAQGASDAGIYVGQSMDAIIRDCRVEKNVNGIEIENTINADVYDNIATDNTGGILVFDLQGLVHPGEKTRIFDNQILNNNRDNFAHEGSLASITPAGTGILVMATKRVEVFDNEITDNNVLGVAVVSYLAVSALTGQPILDPEYDPFYNEVYIHDNGFSKNNQVNVTGQSDIGLLLLSVFGSNPIPDIVVDGIFHPAAGENGGVCLKDNTGAAFVNLDVANQFANPSFDPTPHDCEGLVLEPVTL
jgi:parallel beta-helix repeat protein